MYKIDFHFKNQEKVVLQFCMVPKLYSKEKLIFFLLFGIQADPIDCFFGGTDPIEFDLI